jgi:16S rRNA (cytosine967-C5)-methyltransferase
LRRNPDAKWKLNEDYIKKVQQQQKEILNSYSAMVKENGKLIYATCSILNSENEMQVKNFLETHKEFLLEEEKRIYPSQGFDGFYIARMKRIK